MTNEQLYIRGVLATMEVFIVAGVVATVAGVSWIASKFMNLD
jgi:hypothetical protein